MATQARPVQAPQTDAAATDPDTARPGPWVLLAVGVFLAVVWGTAYTLISVGVRDLEPVWLVALRTLLGAGLVAAYMYAKDLRFPPLRDRRWLVFGLLGQTGITIPFILVAIAQTRVPSGLTGILIGVVPILTVVLAHLVGTERLTRAGFAGFVLGFFGIVVLFLPEEISLSLVAEWRHQLLLVAASVLYAFTTVSASRAPPTPSAVGAAIMLVSSAATALLAAFATGLPSGPITATEWVVIAALGIGSTALGTILYVWAAKRGGAGYVAKINYFPPIVSVIAGVAFLRETVDWRFGVAVVLVLAGMAVSRPRVGSG